MLCKLYTAHVLATLMPQCTFKIACSISADWQLLLNALPPRVSASAATVSYNPVLCRPGDHPRIKQLKQGLAETEAERDRCEARIVATETVLSDPELVADCLAFYK